MSTLKHTDVTVKGALALGKQRSYAEVVDFLNSHWNVPTKEKTLERMKKIDALFGSPSQKITSILIEGTNGKSLTAHYATKLFQEEGFTVGTYYSPHILTYNERFSLNNENISNKTFTEYANEIINTLETHAIVASSQEILTQLAFNYFHTHNVDVVLLESLCRGSSDPVSLCKPSIVAITRITADDVDDQGYASDTVINQYLETVSSNVHVLSADQNKANLKKMELTAKDRGAHWGMPVRKLVPFPYPFEQLHGRCGALAERIVATYINACLPSQTDVTEDSLVAKKQGQRGRPTLEAKRASELNPKKTIEQFWKETSHSLSGRFQLLEKEKPTILLDNANNIDSLENVLLGIRLLHYNRTLKGLTIILGCESSLVEHPTFLKTIRYFFKKTSGNIIVCPTNEYTSWDVEKTAEAMRSLKIKARSATSFKEAFELAKKTINERHGLIAITGSTDVVREYWNNKGIKKL